MTDIPDKVTKIVAEHLPSTAWKISPDAHLENDLGADSLDRVELTMALEEDFDLSISDKEASAWATVGDVITFVQNHHTESTDA